MTWGAILPLVGVLIGASLSPFVAHHYAREKEREERRRDAYLAFVRAIGEIANKQTSDPHKIDALRKATIEIMIYGSRMVMEAVRQVLAIKDLGKPEARPAFTSVIIAMRRDARSEAFQSEAEFIESALFGENK